MNEIKPTIPPGHLEYEFLYDRHISPRDVHLNCYKPNGEQYFGMKMDIDDWKGFVKMINNFDLSLERELETIETIKEHVGMITNEKI